MIYKGSSEFDNGDGTFTEEPLTSATGYLGVLAEYDLHFEPDCCPNLSFFVGVGTRFWIRDLKDGVTDYGDMSWGYQEFWWTFYPYIGLEKKRSLSGGWEFYYAARIGCTAMTYQYATWGGVPLYPKAGLTGQLEAGLRAKPVRICVYRGLFLGAIGRCGRLFAARFAAVYHRSEDRVLLLTPCGRECPGLRNEGLK